MLRLDPFTKLLLASGIVPLAILAPGSLVALGGAALALALVPRGGKGLAQGPATTACAFGALCCGAYFASTGDSILSFTYFFLVVMVVTLFSRSEGRALVRLRVTTFVVLLVVATRTLEMEFLLFLLAFSLMLVMSTLAERYPGVLKGRRKYRYVLAGAAFVGLSLIIAVPIFMVLPRADFVLFDAVDLPSITGFGGEVSLGEMVQLKRSGKLFMRVFAKESRRWRGRVLNVYEDGRWKSRRISGHVYRGPTDGRIWLNRTVAEEMKAEDLFVQEFVLEPYLSSALFSAATPLAVEMDTGEVGVDSGCLYRPGRPRYRKFSYRVYSKVPEYSQEELLAGRGPLDRAYLQSSYLKVPPGLDRLGRLAEQLAGSIESFHRKASVLEKYLQENYEYTLDLPGVPPGTDPVEAFLFTNKRGHCEYFATALALMLRTLGVPTRLVTGFSFGEYNEFGQYWNVREADAHAWVEAWIPGCGWIEYDPTPGGEGEVDRGLLATLGLTGSAGWLRMKAWLDALDVKWQRDVVGYTARGQEEFVARITDRVLDLLNAGGRTFRRMRRWVRRRKAGLVLALLVLLAVSLAGGRVRVLRLWKTLLERLRARWVRGEDSGGWQARAPFYKTMLTLLERRGVPRHPAWTASEYAGHVAKARPDLASPVSRLTGLYSRAVYEGKDLTETELREAAHLLRTLRKNN